MADATTAAPAQAPAGTEAEWTLAQLEQWAVSNFETEFRSLPHFSTLEFRQKLGMDGDNLSEVLIGHIHHSHIPGLEAATPEESVHPVWAGIETVMWVPEVAFHIRKEDAIEHLRTLVPKVTLVKPFWEAAPLRHVKDREAYIWPLVCYYLMAAGLLEKVPLQLELSGQKRDFRKDFRRACINYSNNANGRPLIDAQQDRQQSSLGNQHLVGRPLGVIGHRHHRHHHHHKRRRPEDTLEAVRSNEALRVNQALKVDDALKADAAMRAEGTTKDADAAIARPETAFKDGQMMKMDAGDTSVAPLPIMSPDNPRDVRYHQQQMDRYITSIEDENDRLKQQLAELPALRATASQVSEKDSFIASLRDQTTRLATDLADERTAKTRDMEKLFKERTHLQIMVNDLTKQSKEKDLLANDRIKEVRQLQQERDSFRNEVVNLTRVNSQIKEKAREEREIALAQERRLREKWERRCMEAEALLRGTPIKIERALNVLQGANER